MASQQLQDLRDSLNRLFTHKVERSLHSVNKILDVIKLNSEYLHELFGFFLSKMKSELFLIQSDLSEAYSQSILRSRSMFSEFREEGQGNLTAGIKKKPNDQKLRGVSDLIEGFFLNNFNLFRFTVSRD